MRKQKIKKISAKLLLAVFIINTICIFGFTSPAMAEGGILNMSVSDHDIYEGESVTITWQTIILPNNPICTYLDYDTEIWMQKDSGSGIKIATVDGTGSKSYTKILDESGTYKFQLIEYIRKIRVYGVIEVSGNWFVTLEDSNEIIVDYTMNVQLDQYSIDEGDSITISWNLISKPNEGKYYFSDYDTEIWMQKDFGSWTKVTTVDYSGGYFPGESDTQYYTMTLSEAGTYKFFLKEYSREKGYWEKNEFGDYTTYISTKGNYFVAEEESNELTVRELLYNLNSNPYVIHQGSNTTISWNVDPKEGVTTYESVLSMKFEDEENWNPIGTFNGTGTHQYTIDPIIQEGCHFFKVDLYLRNENSKATSELYGMFVNRIEIDSSTQNQYNEKLTNYHITTISDGETIMPSTENLYEIGESEDKEIDLGFLLTYEKPSDIELFSQEVLLDNTFIEIEGTNDIIPFPEEGSHTIQLFGHFLDNNTVQKCISEIISFKVEYMININSPIDGDIVVFGTGDHPSTYGFEDEPVDETGRVIASDNGFVNSWRSHPNDNVNIVDYGTHRNVLKISDYSTDDFTYVTHVIKDPQSKGIIEFYHLYDDNPYPGEKLITFYDQNTKELFKIGIETHGWFDDYNLNGLTGEPPYPYPECNIWYHHSLEFDADEGSNGKVSWTLRNEMGEVINQITTNFIGGESSGKKVSKICIETGIEDAGYSHYFDAFGFSWDPLYTVGDNLYRGIEIEYDSNFEKNWLHYNNLISYEFTSKSINLPYYESTKYYTVYITGEDLDGNQYISNIVKYSCEKLYIDVKIVYDSKAEKYLRNFWHGKKSTYLVNRVDKALNVGFGRYWNVEFRTKEEAGWFVYDTTHDDFQGSLNERIASYSNGEMWDKAGKRIPNEDGYFDLLIIFTFDDDMDTKDNPLFLEDVAIGGIASSNSHAVVINLGWDIGGWRTILSKLISLAFLVPLPMQDGWHSYFVWPIPISIILSPGILSTILHEVGHTFGLDDSVGKKLSVMDYLNMWDYHSVFDQEDQSIIERRISGYEFDNLYN